MKQGTGLIKPLKIGSAQLKNNLFLSPLAGFTDIAFRRLCRDFGAGLTVTEMISVKGLCYKNKNTVDMLKLAENEKPSCVQLFGSEPDFFLEAIKSGTLENFDIIDINMGCPMPKITKNGDGSALLKDSKKAAQIVEALAKTGRNITVKMRTGIRRDSVTAVRHAKDMENAGAKMITVHGRTAEDMYSGQADWEEIGNVANAVSIPVIGNGDIKSETDIFFKLKNYGVKGVMIGRGAIGRPDIFSINDNGAQINFLSKSYDGKYLLKIILKHIEYMEQNFTEKYIISNMRKHLAFYLKGIPDTKLLKTEINKITKLELLKQVLTGSLS